MSAASASSGGRGLAEEIGRLGARIDRLPRWGLPYPVFIVVGLAYFFAFYDISAISFSLPALTKQFALTGAELAYPVTFNLLGYAIGAYVLGVFADRSGRRPALLITVIVLAVGGILTALSWDVWSLTVFRFITGLGMGAEIALAATVITELSPHRSRPRNVQLMYLFGAAGLTIAPFIAIGLLAIGPIGWRLVFAFGAIVAIMLAFMRDRWLPESPRWLIIHGRQDAAEDLVAQMEELSLTRSGLSSLPAPAASIAEEKYATNPIRELLRRPYLGRTLVVFGFWFTWYITVYGYLGYYPTILIKLGLSTPQGLLFAALGQSATFIGGIVALLLVNVGHRKNLMASFAIVYVIGLLLVIFHASGGVLFIGSFLSSMMIAANSMGYLYTAEVFPTRMRATALAMGDGIGHLGGVIAPFIVTAALGSMGAVPTLWIMIAFLVAAAVIIGIGGIRTTGKRLTELAK